MVAKSRGNHVGWIIMFRYILGSRGWEAENWRRPVEDVFQWRAVVNTIMNIQVS